MMSLMSWGEPPSPDECGEPIRVDVPTRIHSENAPDLLHGIEVPVRAVIRAARIELEDRKKPLCAAIPNKGWLYLGDAGWSFDNDPTAG